MTIRILPDNLINQIAAGEVIERPASVIKELVENAIDAGAETIEVTLAGGGKNLIIVSDDGKGMSKDELTLAVERHATSKLPDDDLFNIKHLGFRGEALPSIAAVSRMVITTRQADAENGWKLEINGGRKSEIMPAALSKGTRIEVHDLFYATPARLKFLKADSAEAAQCVDILNRIAMANPHVSFYLTSEGRRRVALNACQGELFDAQLKRLSEVMGKEFAENSILIDASREHIQISGYVSLPTLNKANSLSQYLFVNSRPVRDKLLLGAIKGGLFLTRKILGKKQDEPYRDELSKFSMANSGMDVFDKGTFDNEYANCKDCKVRAGDKYKYTGNLDAIIMLSFNDYIRINNKGDVSHHGSQAKAQASAEGL